MSVSMIKTACEFEKMFALCFCFFFSSRRRHTRLQGDWSSDVCSSDLVEDGFDPGSFFLRVDLAQERGGVLFRVRFGLGCGVPVNERGGDFLPGSPFERSEEGRVGKEGRFRGSPDHLKKKKRKIRCEQS